MTGRPFATVTARAVRVVALRALLAVVAGVLLFASFPPRPLWFLAPVGIALLVGVSTAVPMRRRAGFGYGYLAGLGFLVPLLPWIGVYVGPLPWLALAAAEAVFVGLFGALVVHLRSLPVAPLWIAAAWSLTEWLRSSVPFGGFPWGRLAFGQPDGGFVSLAVVGGAPLVSFAVAATGAGLAALALTASRRPRPVRAWTVPVAVTLLGPLLAAAAWPLVRTATDESSTVTVAAIQGSVPRLGLDFNAQRKAVLDNHVARTLVLAEDVAAGRAPAPDVVIWPENASDIDPLRNADAARDISAASAAIDAPILVGAVLVNDDRTTTNSVIVWDAQTGPGERHDKKIIQPFGEYLPWRSFFRLFSEYADRAGHFVPGDGDGMVTAGGIDIGVATCYEVAFDRAFRDSIDAGAQLLAVPTNNATFGDTEMTYQQLAMSRVRAVEHGRAVIVAATSGVSAIVDPAGRVQQSTPLFVPDALVAQVPVRADVTLASRLGVAPELVLCAAAVAAAGFVLVRGRREKAGAAARTSTGAAGAPAGGRFDKEDL
ncbi:apolipoprotein N-acyltransferase [Rhodococcus pyridinivorans]|uniref:apolipoprotein N-acyltransferase n=1 Tax=Rhodococcus pyridinivorans TaxID=103816 RepID=UPI0022271148|nr:apolipoprotein N-acyltransferase [Rhodococcus pyridinivorans]MCW3472339.1 apolipoprotein N-acyltransferase [Rhodococcus pyridinivorans]